MKAICFHGRSLSWIRNLPVAIKREVGYQLDRIQRGLDPVDWKPLSQVGQGAKEIRIQGSTSVRVIYLAFRNGQIDVLHAFLKKSRKTRLKDIRIARAQYKSVMKQQP